MLYKDYENKTYTPDTNGYNHLNIYSKSNLEISRLLSNFANIPIQTEDGHFDSIEGYWGWLSISENNPARERLRYMSGSEAKSFKETLYKAGDPGRFDNRFEEKIKEAIKIKFNTSLMQKKLKEYKDLLVLPLTHYYTINGKVIDVTEKYKESFVDILKENIDEFLEKDGYPVSLFDLSKGIICQQVNCQNTINSKLFLEMSAEFSEIENKYHYVFCKYQKSDIFGQVQLVPLNENKTLMVANIFSQFNNGNYYQDKIVYTNEEKLINGIYKVAIKYPDLPIFIPVDIHPVTKEEIGIGCGNAGGDWKSISSKLYELNLPNLYLLNIREKTVKRAPYEENKEMKENLKIQLGLDIDESLYKGRVVCFDTETTGLSNQDELLQISIVNEDKETILDTYLKPTHVTSWVDAMKVNHISPDMVKDSPYAGQYKDILNKIFKEAGVITGYNVNFDIKMVEANTDLQIPRDKVFDCLPYFKKDVPSGKHKLLDAVKYYAPESLRAYENGAHNSLVDTIATVEVYNQIKALEKDKEL